MMLPHSELNTSFSRCSSLPFDVAFFMFSVNTCVFLQSIFGYAVCSTRLGHYICVWSCVVMCALCLRLIFHCILLFSCANTKNYLLSLWNHMKVHLNCQLSKKWPTLFILCWEQFWCEDVKGFPPLKSVYVLCSIARSQTEGVWSHKQQPRFASLSRLIC